jgi:hypothetical protein
LRTTLNFGNNEKVFIWNSSSTSLRNVKGISLQLVTRVTFLWTFYCFPSFARILFYHSLLLCSCKQFTFVILSQNIQSFSSPLSSKQRLLLAKMAIWA